MRKVSKHTLYILSAIIVLNIFSYFIFFRLDFTTNKRYSLSNVSKEVIQNNNEPIVVDFYVSEDLPQNIQKLAQEFLSLLKEYKSISKTDFSINIIHPNTLEKEMQANQAGIDIFFKKYGKKM